MLFFLPRVVCAQAQPSERCCGKDIQMLILAVDDPRLSGVFITVSIDKSPRAKAVAEAFTYPSRTNQERRDIVVSDKLRQILTHDEFLAALAHELGHAAQPANISRCSLEGEYFADDMALKALAKLGINAKVMLTMLQKVINSPNPFLTRRDMVNGKKRLQRFEEIVMKEVYKDKCSSCHALPHNDPADSSIPAVSKSFLDTSKADDALLRERIEKFGYGLSPDERDQLFAYIRSLEGKK